MLFVVVDNNKHDLDLLALAIVMLSDSELNRVNALQTGSTYYFQKPISAEQVERVMRQISA